MKTTLTILLLGAFSFLFFVPKPCTRQCGRRPRPARSPMASGTRNQQGQPSSETTRARTAWHTSGLLWYDLEASASETGKEIVVRVSARSCGTRFVGAAAGSVHSLLMRAVPCWPLRRRSYGATISLRRRLPLGAKCAPRWPRRSPRQAAGLTTPGVADLHQWEQMGQGQLLCPRAAAAFQQSHRGVTVVVGARGAHHSGPHNFAQY